MYKENVVGKYKEVVSRNVVSLMEDGRRNVEKITDKSRGWSL